MAHWSFSAGFEAQRVFDAVDDLRRRVNRLERLMDAKEKHPAIVDLPSAPFAPTLEDFNTLNLLEPKDYSHIITFMYPRNNDNDDDGA